MTIEKPRLATGRFVESHGRVSFVNGRPVTAPQVVSTAKSNVLVRFVGTGDYIWSQKQQKQNQTPPHMFSVLKGFIVDLFVSNTCQKMVCQRAVVLRQVVCYNMH